MGTLRIEEPEVAGVVGLEPDGGSHVRLEFDETGLVVSVQPEAGSAFDGSHDMPPDGEAPEDGILRPTALRHDDIRLQDAQTRPEETGGSS